MHNHAPANYECLFCKYSSGNETAHNKKADIVYEDSYTLAFISPKWWLNNHGGAIVIPKKHYENIYDISDDLLSAIQITGKKVALAIKESYPSDGVSFRQHNEPAGNQDVWHFHLHVLPRYKNDMLYQKHDEAVFVNEEQRKPYAEKLKEYFDSIK